MAEFRYRNIHSLFTSVVARLALGTKDGYAAAHPLSPSYSSALTTYTDSAAWDGLYEAQYLDALQTTVDAEFKAQARLANEYEVKFRGDLPCINWKAKLKSLIFSKNFFHLKSALFWYGFRFGHARDRS